MCAIRLFRQANQESPDLQENDQQAILSWLKEYKITGECWLLGEYGLKNAPWLRSEFGSGLKLGTVGCKNPNKDGPLESVDSDSDPSMDALLRCANKRPPEQQPEILIIHDTDSLRWLKLSAPLLKTRHCRLCLIIQDTQQALQVMDYLSENAFKPKHLGTCAIGIN